MMLRTLLQALNRSPRPAPLKSEDKAASAPSRACAIWNDISRALDQAPRSSVERARAGGSQPGSMRGGSRA